MSERRVEESPSNGVCFGSFFHFVDRFLSAAVCLQANRFVDCFHSLNRTFSHVNVMLMMISTQRHRPEIERERAEQSKAKLLQELKVKKRNCRARDDMLRPKMLNKLRFSPMTLFGKRHRNDHFDVRTRQCGQLHIVREKMTNCTMVVFSSDAFGHLCTDHGCAVNKIFCFHPFRTRCFAFYQQLSHILIMMDGNAFLLVIAHIITIDRTSESISTTTLKHTTFSEWMLKQFTIIVMWWLLVTKGAKPLIIDFKSLAFEQICFCINFYIGPPFGKGLHVCETGVDCSIASYFLCHQRCAVCVSLRIIDLVFQKCFDRFFILIVAILIWYLLFSGVQPCYCFLSF